MKITKYRSRRRHRWCTAKVLQVFDFVENGKLPRLGLILIILVVQMACGDPSLLYTPLPNGYGYKSNGGEFGYITTPDKKRMSAYFGILNNGEEHWCGRFGWVDAYVTCEMVEYTGRGLKTDSKGFFFLNTTTGEIVLFASEIKIREYWNNNLRTPFPQLGRSYTETIPQ